MTTTEAIQAKAETMTKNQNVVDAVGGYFLWLSWYDEDYKGAVEFAGDHLETEADLDELIAVLAELFGVEIAA